MPTDTTIEFIFSTVQAHFPEGGWETVTHNRICMVSGFLGHVCVDIVSSSGFIRFLGTDTVGYAKLPNLADPDFPNLLIAVLNANCGF